MSQLIADHVQRGESFAFESTLADGSFAQGSLRQLPAATDSARLGRESMNPKPIEKAKNPLLARALPALVRARKRAEELALTTNTSLVEMVDGEIVLVKPPRARSRKR